MTYAANVNNIPLLPFNRKCKFVISISHMYASNYSMAVKPLGSNKILIEELLFIVNDIYNPLAQPEMFHRGCVHWNLTRTCNISIKERFGQ